MPLYEYDCSKCGEHLEAIQKFSDAPLATCPKCSGPLVKQLSLGSFHLKGSGWYNTDYRKSAKSAPSNAENSSSATGEKAAPSTTKKD